MGDAYKFSFVSTNLIKEESLREIILENNVLESLGVSDEEMPIAFGAIQSYMALGISPIPILDLSARRISYAWKAIEQKLKWKRDECFKAKFGDRYIEKFTLIQKQLLALLLNSFKIKPDFLPEFKLFEDSGNVEVNIKFKFAFNAAMLSRSHQLVGRAIKEIESMRAAGFLLSTICISEELEATKRLKKAIKQLSCPEVNRIQVPLLVEPDNPSCSVYAVSGGHYGSNRRK